MRSRTGAADGDPLAPKILRFLDVGPRVEPKVELLMKIGDADEVRAAETALTRCPGPIIAASISPAISAATARGLRGIKINCMSSPCFLNRPRSRATHTAVMLSLVTLDDKFDLICAFRNRGAQIEASTRLAKSRQKKALRIITVLIGRAFTQPLA